MNTTTLLGKEQSLKRTIYAGANSASIYMLRLKHHKLLSHSVAMWSSILWLLQWCLIWSKGAKTKGSI